jgi:hypothetical protein
MAAAPVVLIQWAKEPPVLKPPSDVAANTYRANRFSLCFSSTPVKVHVLAPEAMCLRRKRVATLGDQPYLWYTSLAIRRDKTPADECHEPG